MIKERNSLGQFTSQGMKGNQYRKGLEPWNKGTKGLVVANKTSFKKGEHVDSKNPRWKGDAVGYMALHRWIHRKLGKAKKCTNNPTHKARVFRWANKSGEYKRDLNDWVELCPSCATKLDINAGRWGEASKKFGLNKNYE